MLGFPKEGAREAKKHLDHLMGKVPVKYHPEIRVLYDWVTDIYLPFWGSIHF